jgi:hypothetical protein
MKIIKVSSGKPEFNNLLLRQTSGMSGVWGDCKFILNSEIKKCDWWFVLHGSGLIKNEECLCDPNHIVYVSMEPNETMSKVSNKFMEQFSHLVTCDRDVKHSNKIYQNWLTWWVGINVIKSKDGIFSKDYNLDYDDLTNIKPLKKLNKISIVYSNKNMSEGHSARIKFLNALINSNISHYIDVFGDGFTPIPDKWDAIMNYKYHLVIENEIQEDYWSEKLADSFLGFAYPIYSGCPNINKYFDENSMAVIDISNFEISLKKIKDIIDGDLYDRNIRAIEVARNQILNEYNIFNLMAKMSTSEASLKKKIQLKTNYYYSDSFFKKIARLILKKLRTFIL